MTPPSPAVRATGRLTDAEVAAVRTLAEAAHAADGVAPLGEGFLLRLPHEASHLLVTREGREIGYAQVAPDGAAELVVDPAARDEGVGRRLAERVLAERPDARVWAHGDLPAARSLARRLGLERVRELLVLRRDLAGVPPAGPAPEGYRVRTFVPGQDEDALLAVNAAAFADHPEQGRLDRAGLAQRAVQPWFDPAGIFLVVDGAGELAAFHWTKVDDPTVGEVYVVGVHPEHQGRGLGGYVTGVGLDHLRRRGLTEAELYVEGDNTAALATYRRAGMSPAASHVMYAAPAPAR